MSISKGYKALRAATRGARFVVVNNTSGLAAAWSGGAVVLVYDVGTGGLVDSFARPIAGGDAVVRSAALRYIAPRVDGG